MQWSLALFAPMIWIFNGSGRFLLRLFGANAVAEHSHVHSPEEIVMLVEESSAGGILDHEERRLLVNTLQMRNITARRVMVPRNRVLAAPVDQDPEDLFHLLAESPYSRLPLYEGSIDKIVGMIHLKDLLQLRYQQTDSDTTKPRRAADVRTVMHPPLFVPDSIAIEDVIAHMQRARNNVAIVVDEFGGTAGLLAIEDLVEQIVGEFQDEFDPEHPVVRLAGKNRLLVRGELHLDEINELLGTVLSSDMVDTIGGLVSTNLGKIPSVGEVAQVDGLQIGVERMDANRVAEVSISLSAEQQARLEQTTNE
jgi:CBS domain containing-hemolysin-like protein